jgi:hypothetical protein
MLSLAMIFIRETMAACSRSTGNKLSGIFIFIALRANVALRLWKTPDKAAIKGNLF